MAIYHIIVEGGPNISDRYLVELQNREDDLNLLLLEDNLTFFKLEDDLPFFKLEDDLSFYKLKDDPPFLNWKMTLNFSN